MKRSKTTSGDKQEQKTPISLESLLDAESTSAEKAGSALYTAVREGNNDIAIRLIHTRRDISTDNAAVALEWAANKGYDGIIRALLDVRKDIPEANLAVSLEGAVTEEHTELAKLLAAAGAFFYPEVKDTVLEKGLFQEGDMDPDTDTLTVSQPEKHIERANAGSMEAFTSIATYIAQEHLEQIIAKTYEEQFKQTIQEKLGIIPTVSLSQREAFEKAATLLANDLFAIKAIDFSKNTKEKEKEAAPAETPDTPQEAESPATENTQWRSRFPERSGRIRSLQEIVATSIGKNITASSPNEKEEPLNPYTLAEERRSLNKSKESSNSL